MDSKGTMDAHPSMADSRVVLCRQEGNAVENELNRLVNALPGLVWTALPDGHIDFLNERWCEYTGLSVDQACGSGWQAAIHAEDLDTHKNRWLASLASGQPYENEARHRSASGEYRWFLVRAVPLRDERGNILKWYGILTDIEDRKQAEALLAAEKRIFEMTAKGDPLGQILDNLCRLAEEQAKGVLTSILLLDGNRLRHGGAPSLPKAYTNAIDGASIGPSAGSCGTAAYRREQVIVENIATDPLWADYRELALPYSLRACWSTPVFSSQGNVIATFAMYYREPRSPSPRDQGIIEQITHLAGVAIERKQTQEALRRSEAYLGQAQRLSHTGSFGWHVSSGEIYWSEETFRIFDIEPSTEPTLERLFERIYPEDRASVRQVIDSAIREGKGFDFEHRLLMPDISVKHVRVVAHPSAKDESGELEFVGAVTDITERKHAEEALRRSETYLAEGQRLSKTGSWAYNPFAQKANYWSEEMFRICELDPRQGPPAAETFLQRIHPEDRDNLMEVLGKAALEKTEYEDHPRLLLPDGTVKYLHAIGHPVFDRSGEVIQYVGTAVDVTERKRAEAERARLRQLEADLAHMNRVSMMGELTASLAHEVKQPIAAAATNARTGLRWLQREPPDIGEAREALSRIVKDVNRAAGIVDRTCALYRRGAPKLEMADLNEFIREMALLLRERAIQHSILIRTELDGALPTITADPVQMQQVLLNLMLNGIEAMKDTGGKLTVRSEKAEDDQILLAVSDLGIGLPVENPERIFDPFFTTKAQGTGMGLSICRKIIESHGGRLWACANTGRGATFQFTLPAGRSTS